MGGSRRAREQGADLCDELVLIGEGAGGLLRVDVPAVEPDLEDAAAAGYQTDARESILIIVRDFFRQTDGFIEVASSGAVFDLKLHDASCCCEDRPMLRPAPSRPVLPSCSARTTPAIPRVREECGASPDEPSPREATTPA